MEFAVNVGVKVGRLDSCEECNAYMRVCKNCRFWDPHVHNECLETTAAFIRDREAPNFCSHFTLKKFDASPEIDTSADEAKSKLNDLFKGLD